MKTFGTIVAVFFAAVVAWWVGSFVLGIVFGLLHWVIILAVIGGVVYVASSLANPNRSLPWRSKSLP